MDDALARFTPEEIAAAEHLLDNDPTDLAPRAPFAPAEIAVLCARLVAANRRPSGSGIG